MPGGKKRKLLVFVHGWSVTHTNTYGGLPERIGSEAASIGLDILVKEIFLGQYVSFRDEVRVEDISRAFDAAQKRELAPLVKDLGRFACITHSTGGPVIRDWAQRYCIEPRSPCPMSHLIMLAPANFGSALAQLGKSRLSRIKAWFEDVEPGKGVLDWLELGSPDAWALNEKWLRASRTLIGEKSFYPFVLTGQSIDRKLYDNLNTYTGEDGSDGVVRVAAANLNSVYVRLEQEEPKPVPGRPSEFEAPALSIKEVVPSAASALLVVPGKSHSGKDKGIMRSVNPSPQTAKDRFTVDAILKCLAVQGKDDYGALCTELAGLTRQTQESERLEIEKRIILSDNQFIHDRYSMLVFRLQDVEGYPLEDYDIILTAGETHDPNLLPRGFFKDRQRNRAHPGTVTYYINYDIIMGCDAIASDGKVYREAQPGLDMIGLRLIPRPDQGFVHYLPCDLYSSPANLKSILKPNATTLVDIVLRRVVREGVFRFNRGLAQRSFKKDPTGGPIQ
jgi:hypothetical protein